MKTVVDFAHERRLVAFVGAGVSAIGPTCLPDWWTVNNAVLDALAAHALGAPDSVPPELIREAASAIRHRQDSGQMPPEYQAEILANRHEDYFELLTCLDGDRPNGVHRTLAALAREGRISAVVTTNFDRVLEVALAEYGVPFEVRATPSAMDELASDLGLLEPDRGVPLQLLKLHGTAEDPSTLVDTLAQRKRGLGVGTDSCLGHLLRHNHWLFLGYSGADLDADHNYIGLRGWIDDAVGFTWLARSGDKPLAVVQQLVDDYRDRARIEFGELPGWLTCFGEVLDDVPSSAVDDDSNATREAAARAIRTEAEEWAKRASPFWSALSIAELSSAAARADLTLQIMRCLYESESGRRSEYEYRVICKDLAVACIRDGQFDEALRLAREALHEHEQLGDDRDMGTCAQLMGGAYHGLGEYDRALDMYQRSLEVSERHGDEEMVGNNINNMANVHHDSGDYDRALELYERDLEIKTRLGNEWGRGRIHLNIANALAGRGSHDQAIQRCSEAMTILERLGDDEGCALVHRSMAYVRSQQGRQAEVADHLRSAFVIRERLGDLHEAGQLALELSFVRSEPDWRAGALEWARTALALLHAAGAPATKDAQARVDILTWWPRIRLGCAIVLVAVVALAAWWLIPCAG